MSNAAPTWEVRKQSQIIHFAVLYYTALCLTYSLVKMGSQLEGFVKQMTIWKTDLYLLICLINFFIIIEMVCAVLLLKGLYKVPALCN